MADGALLLALLDLRLGSLVLGLSLLSLLSRRVRLSLRLRLGVLQHLLLEHLVLDRILTLRRAVRYRLTGLIRHLHPVGRDHRFALVVLQLCLILDRQATLGCGVSFAQRREWMNGPTLSSSFMLLTSRPCNPASAAAFIMICGMTVPSPSCEYIWLVAFCSCCCCIDCKCW